MTPAARLQSSIELLDLIAEGPGPTDAAVTAWLRRRRFVGAKDRRAITDRVYWGLRHRAVLDWWVARAEDLAGDLGQAPGQEPGGDDGVGRRRAIAALVLAGAAPREANGEAAGEANEEAVAALFDGGRYHPAPLTGPEVALARALAGQSLNHPDQPVSVRGNFPAWIEASLAASLGDRLEAEMVALNAPAPFDLRVNTLKATRAEAQAALLAEGIDSQLTPLSPLGLRLPRRRPLGGVAAFKGGLVEVQDEGAQIVSLLVDARPGMRVVDFCAGAGGKTLALAAAMANLGCLLALDTAARLKRAAPRLARAGVEIAACHLLGAESAALADPWVAANAAVADRVLLDVPCTGLGAWRRDPGARWRYGPEDLRRLTMLQRKILATAAPLVRPGGRLIYATCSLLNEENEDQVAAFLAAHGAFCPIPVAEIWPGTVGGACPDEGSYLRITPARHGTDGFFVAILERCQ